MKTKDKARQSTIGDLKELPGNPRSITSDQRVALGESLQRFGDLSGIVFNRKTGHLVGGHQRVKVLQSSGNAKIEVETRYKAALPDGSLAVGFVVLDGERYSYREVEWDKITESLANLAANKLGGSWDDGALAVVFESMNGDGTGTGFSDDEISALMSGAHESIATDEPVGSGDHQGKSIETVGVTCPHCGEDFEVAKD